MEKRVIYTNEDGGLSVVIPAPDSGLTAIEVASLSVPVGVPFEIVDESAIPGDRTFRGAWKKSGARVVHDMAKAKQIAHVMRRRMRAQEMEPFDLEATIPEKAAAAEDSRKVIRARNAEMQAAIDAAAGVVEIKKALGL